MRSVLRALALMSPLLAGCATPPEIPPPAVEADVPRSALDERIAYYAQGYDVPESMIQRSVQRESGYNPAAHHGPYWGLMQIRLDTAKGVGYRGPARGLLDADTNLKYAVAYLANAYLVAGRNPDRALRLYAGGFYYEARRKGLLDQLKMARDE